MKRNINIKIEGTTASGKSAVAHAIKNALLPYGVTVEKIWGCEDEHEGILERDWEARLTAIGPELTTNIETKRTFRANVERGNV